MKVEYRGSIKVLIADEGKKITNSERTFFSDFIYLGKNDSPDNYVEVGREIWKHFVEEENPDVNELQNITKDLQSDVQNLQDDTNALRESQLIRDETDNMIMSAIVDSDEKHETLTDVLLRAIDDLYAQIEPLLTVSEELCIMGEFESKSRINVLGGDSMVELYAVMIQRGLKTIEQVPARYREQVQALLTAVE